MVSATSHTRKDYQTLQELETVLSKLNQTLNDIEASRVAEQDDIGAIDHHWHSRWRVYPQDVQLSITLAAAAAADTFGDWVLIIPLNTVPFDFDIIGIVVETANTNLTTYFAQLGYNTINAEPGANMEMGERRFRIAEQPIRNASEILQIRSQEVPANSTVWGRLKAS
ncbi:unnamed protein product, partial [marine sediment metagenome]